MFRFLRAALVLPMLTASMAEAQSLVPPLISFSGLLTDDGGIPVSEAVSVVFKLYDDPVTTTHLWTETQQVEIVDGVFSVHLGDVTPISDSVFDRTEVYLGMKIGTDDEMEPRHRLTSSGWAFRSGCVVTVWYADTDEDGFGDETTTTTSCTMPEGFVSNGDDCDDGNPGSTVETTWYADVDEDLFGDPLTETLSCTAPPDYIDTGGDCDDSTSAVNPGAIEICDGLDNNCSSIVDEGVSCNDANECTSDSCDGFSGCTNTNVANGTACTGGTCQNGACTP